jgi:hypothetical protein
MKCCRTRIIIREKIQLRNEEFSGILLSDTVPVQFKAVKDRRGT